MIKLTSLCGGGWAFFFGANKDTPARELTQIDMGGRFIFSTRREAVLAAQAMSLSVDKRGIVS